MDNAMYQNLSADSRRTKAIKRGRQSVALSDCAFICECASIVGQKEGNGPLGKLFDMVGNDELFGESTWEEAEGALQKDAVSLVIGKAGIRKEQIDFLLGGDLLGQDIASYFGIKDLNLPFIGLFGACSTCGEALAVASLILSGQGAQYVACVTSSHFGSAEKEFRFPMEYGGQRPISYTRTVTGSGAFLLSSEKKAKAYAKIAGVTIGKIVDMNMKDSFNMGCCMAPAAADTIYAALTDFGMTPNDFDKIITGDLGGIGKEALCHLLREKGIDIGDKYTDCGMEIFSKDQSGTESGGSGCGCAATVLAAYILPKIREKSWKRILFVPTGALLNKTSFNEGKPILGIAHAVILESLS